MWCVEGAIPGPFLHAPQLPYWVWPPSWLWLCTSICSTYLTSDSRPTSLQTINTSPTWVKLSAKVTNRFPISSSGHTSFQTIKEEHPGLNTNNKRGCEAAYTPELDAFGSTSWGGKPVHLHIWYGNQVWSITPRSLLWRQTSMVENLHVPKDEDRFMT